MKPTLAELLSARVTEFAESPQVIEMIDKSIEKMFSFIVSECFSSYSDMAKQVKASVTAALPGNISNLFELKRYNALIVEHMQREWERTELEDDMKNRLEALLKNTLGECDFPPIILLSDFMEAFAELHQERAFEEGWEAPKVIYKENEGITGFHSLYIDKNPEEACRFSPRSEYELECRIAFTTNGEGVFRTKDRFDHDVEYPLARVFSAVLNGKPARDNINPHRFDRMVQALYYGMSRIAIDCNPEDTCYPCND